MIANVVNLTNGGMPNAIGNGAAPETAGFDFMNYLLGLQTTSFQLGDSEANGPADVNSLLGALAPADAEAGKSSKKELEPWNLIFPAMVPNAEANPNLIANAIPESKGSQAAPAVDALLAKVGLAPQPTELKGDAGPDKVWIDSKHPDLKGARILSVETFSEPVQSANPAPQVQNVPQDPQVKTQFTGTLAHLQAQGKLSEQTPAVPQHAVAQKYSQVDRLDQEVNAPVFSEEVAAVAEPIKERKEVSLDPKADPSVLAVGNHNHTQQMGEVTKPIEVAATDSKQNVPQLMQRVGTLAQGNGGSIKVSLTPPELGNVEVQVTTRGKRVEIKMMSDSSLAKSVLESGLGDLKRQLEGHNLQLARTEVQVSREHFNSPGQQFAQQFSQQHQQQGGFHSSRDERGSNFGNAFGKAEPVGARVEAVAARRMAVAPGRVDVRI